MIELRVNTFFISKNQQCTYSARFRLFTKNWNLRDEKKMLIICILKEVADHHRNSLEWNSLKSMKLIERPKRHRMAFSIPCALFCSNMFSYLYLRFQFRTHMHYYVLYIMYGNQSSKIINEQCPRTERTPKKYWYLKHKYEFQCIYQFSHICQTH